MAEGCASPVAYARVSAPSQYLGAADLRAAGQQPAVCVCGGGRRRSLRRSPISPLGFERRLPVCPRGRLQWSMAEWTVEGCM